MLYPANIEGKLGFTEIRERLDSLCLSNMGKELVAQISFSSDFTATELALRETEELKQSFLCDSQLPSTDFPSLEELASLIRVEGTFLVEEKLHQLALGLRTVALLYQYVDERKPSLPLISLLQPRETNMASLRYMLDKVRRVIDELGVFKISSSPAYQELSRKISAGETAARKQIDRIYKEAAKAGWTADGSLTVRDGRLCIPVLAEHKRKMRGFIHDESATGQTVFLEPEEIFQINNRIRDDEFERRREKTRVLKEVAEELRIYFDVIVDFNFFLARIDIIRAKALFAIEINAHLPELVHAPLQHLVEARHPLLEGSLAKAGIAIVPLSLKLDDQERVLLVSGPNAGGKSVCLKTVGLLQLMLQSGLLIPARPESQFGIFEDLLLDIGDDQSIDSDLSTYSAHLRNMKTFLLKGRASSLILIDEFGTGTDPVFGGPIAEAVLEQLMSIGVKGLVTTHYSNLKVFAASTTGLSNASMLFDNRRLIPLYRLQTGNPGSSYALEIAEKIGLPTDVITLAKEKIGEERKNVEQLLVAVEQEKAKILKERNAVAEAQLRLDALTQVNEEVQQYLSVNKKKILQDARTEASEILRNANRLVEQTISQIKSTQADKDSTKQAREVLAVESRRLKEREVIAPVASNEVLFKAGDWVTVVGHENPAQILSVSKGNAVLTMGDLRSVVKLERLKKVNKQEEKKIGRKLASELNREHLDFSSELDIRGLRGEEGMRQVERLLDRALMLGVGHLKIIHGKGDGILRKLVRSYANKQGSVSKVEDEHPDRGGEGITYITLS